MGEDGELAASVRHFKEFHAVKLRFRERKSRSHIFVQHTSHNTLNVRDTPCKVCVEKVKGPHHDSECETSVLKPSIADVSCSSKISGAINSGVPIPFVTLNFRLML